MKTSRAFDEIVRRVWDGLRGKADNGRIEIMESLLLCPKRDRSAFALALYDLKARDALMLHWALHQPGLVTGDWRRSILSAKLQELENLNAIACEAGQRTGGNA
jgi:hypothetical protein